MARNEERGSHSSARAGSSSRPKPSVTSKPSARRTVKPPRPTGQGSRHQNYSKSRGSMKNDKPTKVLAIIAVVLLLVVIGVGGFAFYSLNKSSEPQMVELPVTVEVPDGASTTAIAGILHDAHLISNTSDFMNEVKSAGADGKLKAGTYIISTTDLKTIVQILVAGSDASLTKLTIPEGYTNKQVAARVEEVLGIPADDFLAIADHKAEDYVKDYPFLEGAYDGSMAGYLFPKTYEIPEGATAEYVITTMLSQFKKEYAAVNKSYAESKGLSDSDIVIIASIIEKETQVADERKLVSSVIYNRLDKNMRLQLCSSVQYILGTNKVRLSEEDISIDSPYNTYKNSGLPPGPISNPGLDSLIAAANPEQTEYLYYVLTGTDGSQTFSKTLEEHNKAKEVSKQVLGQ